MREIVIGPNDHEQRADRFLNKYFPEANRSFLQKMIRKKRIKLNNSRINPEDIINEGDVFQIYFSDETIDKFRGVKSDSKTVVEKISDNSDIEVVYEDQNIILINKPVGLLSHSAEGSSEEDDIVSRMISYLYKKGDYKPQEETTFTPSICNRLDRNTSGVLIGAKNYDALKSVNEAIRNRDIRRFYKTIVKGRIDEQLQLRAGLTKSDSENIVYITDDIESSDKEICTDIVPLKSTDTYSIVEIELITGRTHQIRAHLAHIGHPVLGDRKYGDRKTNQIFSEEFGLSSQLLHAYKLVFNGFSGKMSYLNGKIVINESKGIFNNIEESIFK